MTDYTPENLTDDQIITLLQMLFTNMNNLDKVYYDLFINTIPMDITLERYDENGTLHTYIIPNRAKDQSQTYLGQGSPEGVQDAKVGSFYLDVLNGNMYIKVRQTERYGWYLVYTANNFRAGIDFMTPDGDGSSIRNLNGSNVSNGIVSASVGGTGTTGLTGILKGNGANPCTVAVPNVDYATPTLFTGMVAQFAGSAPIGWLVADGAIYLETDYPALSSYLNGAFNNGLEPLGYFRVPDLRGMFIRGYDDGTRGLDTTEFSGTLTYGSTTISNITNINPDMFAIGLKITGEGIPDDTVIISISSTNTITLSNPVTSSGTKSLTLISRRFGSYQLGSSISGGALSVSMWNYDGYPSGGEAVPGVRAVSYSGGSGTQQLNPINTALLYCIKY